MLIETQSTTLLEIFYEFLLYFWDISKKDFNPDDTKFQGYLYACVI